MIQTSLRPSLFSRRAWSGIVACCVVLALLPLLNLMFDDGHALHVPSYLVGLVGKFMCYALAALALDMVWGYTGILSLGHGVFFALGAYAHGMYLMRAIGRDSVYQSDLPDFMVFLDWKTYPWYWAATDSFWYCLALVVLVPGVLAFVARFESNEMQLITVLGLCFGFCLLVVKLEYSMVLGAFLIGESWPNHVSC